MEKAYSLGIDIGSTTVKVAILNKDNEVVFSDYRRHFASIIDTLKAVLNDAKEKLGDISCKVFITGSGGLGLSKALKIPFVQESLPHYSRKHYRDKDGYAEGV